MTVTINGTTGLTVNSNVFTDASGNVGVGTTSPNTKIEAYTTSSGNQGLLTLQQANNTVGNSWGIDFRRTASSANSLLAQIYAYRDGNDATGLKFSYATSGAVLTEGMRLDTSGNLGLGVPPSAWGGGYKAVQVNGAHIMGSSTNLYAQFGVNNYWNGTGDVYISNGYALSYQQASGQHRWFTAPSGTAGNAISFTQAMTLDASGGWWLGTAPGSVNTGFALSASGIGYAGHPTGTASGTSYFTFRYNNGDIGSITQNGTTGVLYNLTSDYRLKNNPVPVTGAKEFINALQPKTWDWWDGSGKGVGFIAHEFMEVAKYSGNGTKDAVDDDGNPVYQSIQPSSSEVMANLVAYVQELRAELDAVKTELAALKGAA